MYICSERNKAEIITGLLVLTDTIKLLTDIEHKQEINNSMHMSSSDTGTGKFIPSPNLFCKLEVDTSFHYKIIS